MKIWQKQKRFIFTLALFFCCFPLLGLAASGLQGNSGNEFGIPQVSNPANSLEGDVVIKPKELWRLGGEDDDQDTIFGLIGDALVDAQGTTYLLDTVLGTIYKVDSEGTVLTNISREGNGPGELSNPSIMSFMPDGTIGVLGMMSNQIVVMDKDGNPRPSFSPSGSSGGVMTQLQRIATTKNSVILGRTIMDFADGKSTTSDFLSRFAPDGTLQGHLLQDTDDLESNSSSNTDEDNDFASHWTLTADGQIVVFQKYKEYKIEVFDPNGDPAKIIRRDFQPVRRSDKAIKKDKKRQESLRKRFGGDFTIPIAEFARHISEVFARPNGDLWVQNSQGDLDCPEHSIGFFDVFNSEGQFVKRVRLEADYNPDRDRFKIQDNHLFIFKEARKAPSRTNTSDSGGGTMVIVSLGDEDDEEEDEEARPYEVVCYLIP